VAAGSSLQLPGREARTRMPCRRLFFRPRPVSQGRGAILTGKVGGILSRITNRIGLAAVAALAACVISGFAFSQENVPSDDVTQQSLKFARVLALVEKHYADPLDPDAAILEGGIRHMLSTLDPFSAFFNPSQFALLKQQTQGRAVGFGTVLYVTPGKVLVLEAAQKSPAARAGLGPGDEIVEVNGQRLMGLDFRSLIELLQQARAHPVTLGILHPGRLVAVNVKLNPEEVAMPSVDIAFSLRPGIAYLHLTSFETKTPQEVLDALRRLGGKDLKGLLLDLRDNHGGVVAAAVNMVSLFLPPGKTVLTMRGRTQPEKTFSTVKAPEEFTMPIVVLVDGETASAAEIAAAALEEHDRAIIAGTATFGKGLVQQVYPLDEKMGLALIAAQYFTPSGRSIQRPLPGTALADPQRAVEGSLDSRTFRTDNGRPLAAGGGITPDVSIPGRALDPWAQFLDERGIFATYASDYLTRRGRVNADFEPGQETLDDFADFLRRHNIRAPSEYWNADRAFLELRIKTEIFNLVFGLDAGNRVQTRGDPQVEKALALVPEVPELLRSPSVKTEQKFFNPQESHSGRQRAGKAAPSAPQAHLVRAGPR
jgi:carboxyl-terminal processing protease